MIDYQPTDGGRAASGRKGAKAGDCVVRAAMLLRGFRDGLPFDDFGTAEWGEMYSDTYRTLALANMAAGGKRAARDGIVRKVFVPVFIRDFGFAKADIGRGTKPTYTQAWDRFGACIVSTSGHVAPVINGTLWDVCDNRQYFWRETGKMQPRKAQSAFCLQPSVG